jgi:hypothetical protein
MTLRNVFMVVALLASAGLAFWGDKTPDQDTLLATPSKNDEFVGSTADNKGRPVTPRDIRNSPTSGQSVLRLRERDVIERIREDALADRTVFTPQSWDPPPPKVVTSSSPQAPNLPYTYVGKKQEAGEWEVYLAFGEEIRVVRSNMTLDGAYQIGVITPPTLGLIYLPLKQMQTLSIGNP